MALTILNLWKFTVTIILAICTVSLAKSTYDGQKDGSSLFMGVIGSLAELTAILCIWGVL